MTTPAAEKLYQAQHEVEMEGKGYAVFNPLNRPKADLPIIYGFNNGGSPGWMHAQLIAEDSTPLGSHLCSAECYMRHDLGILEGTRPDRHEKDFQPHYPEGYRMEFVSGDEFDSHVGLQKAIWEHNYKAEKALEKENENE